MMRSLPIAVAALGLLGACDTQAQPSTASASPVADPERLSREYESCGTTAHCSDGLRCFAQTCERVARVVFADYLQELGGRQREANDLDGALASYASALERYELDKLAVPIDLECAYGSALAADRNNKERAELAARVLHRCVTGMPAGSPMRHAALREASALHEVGLDGAHLGKDQPADVYLSRAPARPRTDALTVSATTSVEPRKGWPEVKAALEGARTALVACWEQNMAEKKQPALVVAVPLKSTYKPSNYDDEPGTYTPAIDAKAPAPAGDAERCVRDVVATAIKAGKGTGEWTATLTVAVK